MGDPTLNSVEDALWDWVDDQTTQLIVFLVGHGANGYLQLRDNEADVLSARHLDQMLDDLQQKRNVQRIVVVYDACFSGSFINELEPPPETTRIVITSSSADGRADFSDGGNNAFSMHFWRALKHAGTQIGGAYLMAKTQIGGSQQIPQICDYDSRHATEAAMVAAADQLCILSGGTRYFIRPHVDHLKVALLEDPLPRAALEAGVVQADRVWVDLLSPIHVPGTDLTGEDLMHALEQSAGADDLYQGSVDLTDGPGTYVVSVKAAKQNQSFNFVTKEMDTIEVRSEQRQAYATIGDGESPAAADAFEPDDLAPAGAVALINDGSPARHTFHRQDDMDGFWLYGLEGETYVFETILQSAVCDPQLDLFSADGAFMLDATRNQGGLGETERLEWTCAASGLYRVAVSNAGETFGGPVSYALRVKKPEAPLAVFVTGQVLDLDGRPLSMMRIRTDDEMTAVSCQDGSFAMLHRPGTFKMTCERDDYAAQTFDVSFSEGGHNWIEVTMGQPTDPDSPEEPRGSSGGSGGSGCFLGALECNHHT
jgi:hypothetical protein